MSNNNCITPQLLTALLSVGPERQQAEQHLQSLCTVDRAKGLVSLLMQNTNGAQQQLAAVLLRRDISTLGDAALLQEMVEPLCTLFLNHGNSARRSLGHCLAELCASLSLLGDCDAVLQTILERIAPSCLQGDAISLHCLAALCESAGPSLCRSGALQQLPHIFTTATISNEAGVEAMTEAIVQAAIASEGVARALVQPNPEDLVVDASSFAAQLGTTLLPLLSKMTHLQDSTKCLEHLSHAAGTTPSLLAGQLSVFSALVQTCLAMQGDARLPALEVLSTLCAVPHVQRSILNNTQEGQSLRTTLYSTITICAQLCVDSVDDDDDDEWANEPATLLQDSMATEEEAAHAEALLCSFLHNLGGGSHSLPVVLPLVESLLANSNDWRSSRAALSVLEQCLYAAPVTFQPHVPVALEAALKLCSHGHVRVQHQALLLLGALCEATTTTTGGRILEAASRLVASPCSKVSAISSVVLVSYCRGKEAATRDQVLPYLGDILLALVQGPLSFQVVQGPVTVNSGALAAQVKAIGAVACLAEATGDDFLPFYAQVMPGLLSIVQTASSHPQVAHLRGAAMEAMTIVGQAVGTAANVYVPDAERVMQIALNVLANNNNDAPMIIPMDQLLSACARIASVMGEKYAPFVHQVLPHLLDRVTEKVDIQYREGNEAGLEATKRGDLEMDNDGNETMTISLPGKGLTKVSINMAKIEEKAQACRAIYEHAAALEASFGPFCAATLAALKPLISFSYSSEVRSTACQAASAVFDAACQAGLPVAQDYLPVLSNEMCQQIYGEGTDDMEVLYALCEALSDTLYFAYRTMTTEDRSIIAKFTASNGSDIVQLLMKLISSCLDRRGKIFQTLQGAHGALSGQDEENELMESLESEQEVLTPLVDSVGYTLKFLKEQFLPIFDAHVAPVLGSFLQVSPDARARFAATALYDDCIEHCGPAAAQKYGAQLAAGVMIGIHQDDDDNVKQVSLYGIAQIARKCPPNTLEPHAQTIISTLLPIANTPKDNADNVAVIENAVSALASLTLIGNAPLGHLKFLNQQALLSTFLTQLPLLQDEDEAKICHGGFCDLVQVGQVHPCKETAVVLRIIAETLSSSEDGVSLTTPETQKQFASILFKMQRDAAPAMEQAYTALTEESQEAVNAMMHHYAPNNNANVVTP